MRRAAPRPAVLRPAALGGLAAALLLALTACGGDDDQPKDDPTTASSTPSTEVDPDDLAGIITDTPTDVGWRVPEVPSSWKRLKTSNGEAQWQVAGTCAVSLFQPAGLGKDKEPTQEQVLVTYAKRTGTAIRAELDVGETDASMFPLVTSTKGVSSTTKVSHARVTAAGGVDGEVYAYRSGDFALVLSTLCGKGAFAETDASDFKPFISRLAIAAKY